MGWRLKGGHDHAKQQQRRQPERQLVGRNDLDDGCGSDPTGHTLAIPLVTGTCHLPSNRADHHPVGYLMQYGGLTTALFEFLT